MIKYPVGSPPAGGVAMRGYLNSLLNAADFE